MLRAGLGGLWRRFCQAGPALPRNTPKRRGTLLTRLSEEEVRAFVRPRRARSQHELFLAEDRAAIEKFLRSKYARAPAYDRAANAWKNKLIRGRKKRQQLLENRRRDPPSEPEPPKLVLHSPLCAEVTVDEEVAASTFAVVSFKSRQYKLCRDDVLLVSALPGLRVGEQLVLDQVNLIANRHFTLLGRPLLPRATVTLAVEEQTSAAKLIVFKKKRRKGYKKSMGFKHPYVQLKVLRIDYEVDEAVAARAVSLV